MRNQTLLIIILFSTFTLNIFSQIKITDNILSFENGVSSPKASLSDIQWLAGTWHGKAFGGTFEEVWTKPSGGSMMGSFKLINDNKVSFYELIIIQEINNTLVIKLKHFHSDLKAWEEKDETIDFPLVKVTENIIYFDGYTFEKINDDTINVYVMVGGEKKEEVKFIFNRVL